METGPITSVTLRYSFRKRGVCLTNDKRHPTSTHYRWGNMRDGWHLVDSTTFSVIREKMPLVTSENLHFHNRVQQLFS